MSEDETRERTNPLHRQGGLWMIIVSVAIFVVAYGYFSDELLDGELVAILSLAVLVGLYTWLNPDIGRVTGTVRRVDGAFWIVVGVVIIGFVIVFDPRWTVEFGGYINGTVFILIGIVLLVTQRRENR